MAITLVGIETVHTGNTTAMDTSSGNLVVAFVVNWPSLAGMVDAHDGCSGPCNTWTQLTETTIANDHGAIYYVEDPSTGTNHVFNTPGAFPGVAVGVFAGAATTAVQDQAAQTTASAASGAAGSITPTEDNELVVAFVGYDAGVADSIDGGFTLAEAIAPDAGKRGVAIAYLIQTTAAAANPTWTMSLSANLNLHIASFKVGTANPTFIQGGLQVYQAINRASTY